MRKVVYFLVINTGIAEPKQIRETAISVSVRVVPGLQ